MKKTVIIIQYNTWQKPPVTVDSREETWEYLSYLFCPACGKKEIWHETGPGDYYLDELHLCRACGISFYLPGGTMEPSNDPVDTDNQVLRQLRTITL